MVNVDLVVLLAIQVLYAIASLALFSVGLPKKAAKRKLKRRRKSDSVWRALRQLRSAQFLRAS